MAYLDQILSFLRDQLGLSAAQAAGVAGNLQVESGFNPGAYNAGEGAIGLAQWEGGRRQALQQFARASGGSETDLKTQLAFMAAELHGSESSAYQQLLAANDPASAAAAFDQYYERSAGTSRQQRIDAAQTIAGGGGNYTGSADSADHNSGGGSSSESVANGMGGVMGSVFTIAVKVVAAGAAAGLVIAGALHTVSSK